MIKFEIGPGAELKDRLRTLVADRGIKNGAIVSLFGEVDSCHLDTGGQTMPPAIAGAVTGAGEIVDGEPHIYLSIGSRTRNPNTGLVRSATLTKREHKVTAYVVSDEEGQITRPL